MKNPIHFFFFALVFPNFCERNLRLIISVARYYYGVG